jgi:hypothetical protein
MLDKIQSLILKKKLPTLQYIYLNIKCLFLRFFNQIICCMPLKLYSLVWKKTAIKKIGKYFDIECIENKNV